MLLILLLPSMKCPYSYLINVKQKKTAHFIMIDYKEYFYSKTYCFLFWTLQTFEIDFFFMTLEIKFDKRVTNIRMHFSIILFSRIYKENLKQTQPYLTYNFKPCVLNLSILHKCYWLVLNYLILIAWSLPYALSIVSQHFSHLF
jgi:hypothetical protein